MKSSMQKKTPTKRRGLGSADSMTRQRVGRTGGLAVHSLRGLQAADSETRLRVARKGGSTVRNTNTTLQ